jgi:hypothetical protein
MFSVHINGVMQLPGIDYVTGESTISFSSPPDVGSAIHVGSLTGTVASIMGDGSTFVFPIMTDLESYNKIMNVLNDASKYYKNPAVADVLDRLKVVVELVKQE